MEEEMAGDGGVGDMPTGRMGAPGGARKSPRLASWLRIVLLLLLPLRHRRIPHHLDSYVWCGHFSAFAAAIKKRAQCHHPLWRNNDASRLTYTHSNKAPDAPIVEAWAGNRRRS